MSAAPDERVAALQAAAEHLALAMSESHAPIDALGRSFERMARAIGQCSQAIKDQRAVANGSGTAHAGASLGQLEAYQAVLEREISVCIESLQFHDRLMQRLNHVGQCLASLIDPLSAQREYRRANLSEGSIELF